MKRRGLSLGLIFFLVLTHCGSSDPATHPSLEEAKLQAKEQSLPILIDFNTDWCPPCKQFDKDSKKDPTLQEALDQVVLVKIDCEKDEGVALARAYAVDRYPTFHLLDSEGNPLGMWTGYQKTMFIKELNQALEDAK